MHKLSILIVLIFTGLAAFAQKRLTGKYNQEIKMFISGDTGIVVEKFYGNRAAFMIKGKNPFNYNTNRVGFIDTTGRIVIQPVYVNCSNFNKGRALVEDTASRKGMINEAGELIIPLRSQNILLCQNGLLMLSVQHRIIRSLNLRNDISIVDRNNHIIIPFGRYSDYATPRPVYIEGGKDIALRPFDWELIIFSPFVYFKKYLGVKKDNKWAVINAKGKEILKAKYDGIEIFNNDIVPVKLNQKFGVADISGKIVIPTLYDRINLTGKNYLYVYQGTKMGLLGLNNKPIIAINFENIIPFSKGFTAYKNEGNTILFDNNGKQIAVQERPVINFPYWGQKKGGYYVYSSPEKAFRRYQNILDFNKINQNGNRQIFYHRNNRWGLMDTTGREITPPLYDDFDRENLNLFDGSNKLIAVKKDNKWGVIDGQGELLLSIIYDRFIYERVLYARHNYNSLSSDRGKIFAQINGKYGIFNSDLQQITPFRYDSLVTTYPTDLGNGNNSSALIRAKINNKWGLLDKNGKQLIPCQYDELVWVYQNLALVQNKGKFGITNLQGKLTADCVYDDIRYNDFHGSGNYNNNLLTMKDGLNGLINSSGVEVAPPIYENIIALRMHFTNKFQVTYKSKLGVLDGASGKLLLPCEYDDLKFYNDNGANTASRTWEIKLPPYITAFKNGRCGLLDSSGKVCLPLLYERIYYNIDDETYTVNKEGKQGIVDKHMQTIIRPNYAYVSHTHRYFYVLHTNNTSGLAKLNGQIIADTLYTKIEFCGDKIILRKANKFGTIDMEGKVIDPFIYSNIECRNSELFKERKNKRGAIIKPRSQKP